MSDTMKPSERAAKALHFDSIGGNVERNAAIIARETGCDKPDPAREIVRRYYDSHQEAADNPIQRGTCGCTICRDAAALHAAGGES